MAIRITCINKAGGQHYDPHTAISHLGWVNDATGATGKSSRQAVYDWLKQNSGNQAYLYPRENQHGTQFVQTFRDQTWTDNLLALPECVN